MDAKMKFKVCLALIGLFMCGIIAGMDLAFKIDEGHNEVVYNTERSKAYEILFHHLTTDFYFFCTL